MARLRDGSDSPWLSARPGCHHLAFAPGMFYPRVAVSQGKHWFWGEGSLILLPLPQLSKSSGLQEVQTPLLWVPLSCRDEASLL